MTLGCVCVYDDGVCVCVFVCDKVCVCVCDECVCVCVSLQISRFIGSLNSLYILLFWRDETYVPYVLAIEAIVSIIV